VYAGDRPAYTGMDVGHSPLGISPRTFLPPVSATPGRPRRVHWQCVGAWTLRCIYRWHRVL